MSPFGSRPSPLRQLHHPHPSPTRSLACRGLPFGLPGGGGGGSELSSSDSPRDWLTNPIGHGHDVGAAPSGRGGEPGPIATASLRTPDGHTGLGLGRDGSAAPQQPSARRRLNLLAPLAAAAAGVMSPRAAPQSGVEDATDSSDPHRGDWGSAVSSVREKLEGCSIGSGSVNSIGSSSNRVGARRVIVLEGASGEGEGSGAGGASGMGAPWGRVDELGRLRLLIEAYEREAAGGAGPPAATRQRAARRAAVDALHRALAAGSAAGRAAATGFGGGGLLGGPGAGGVSAGQALRLRGAVALLVAAVRGEQRGEEQEEEAEGRAGGVGAGAGLELPMALECLCTLLADDASAHTDQLLPAIPAALDALRSAATAQQAPTAPSPAPASPLPARPAAAPPPPLPAASPASTASSSSAATAAFFAASLLVRAARYPPLAAAALRGGALEALVGALPPPSPPPSPPPAATARGTGPVTAAMGAGHAQAGAGAGAMGGGMWLMVAQMVVFALYKLVRSRPPPQQPQQGAAAADATQGAPCAAPAPAAPAERWLVGLAAAGGVGRLAGLAGRLPDRPSRDMAASLMLDMAALPQVGPIVASRGDMAALVAGLAAGAAPAAAAAAASAAAAAAGASPLPRPSAAHAHAASTPAAPDPVARMYCLLVAARLCNGSPECQMDAVREGALPPLLALLSAGCPEEATHACRLLAILAQAVPTHGAFSRAGVAAAVLDTLRGHAHVHSQGQGQAYVAAWGSAAGNGGTGGGRGDGSEAETAAAALLAEHASSVLAVLAQNGDTHFGLVGSGAVPALVPLLRAGTPRSRSHALAVLMLLADGCQRHAAVVARAGALPGLVGLAAGRLGEQAGAGAAQQGVAQHGQQQAGDGAVREFAAAVLCSMSRYVDVLAEVIDSGAVPALTACLAAASGVSSNPPTPAPSTAVPSNAIPSTESPASPDGAAASAHAAAHAAEALVHALAGDAAAKRRLAAREPAAVAALLAAVGAGTGGEGCDGGVLPNRRYWSLQLLRTLSTDDAALAALAGCALGEQSEEEGKREGAGEGMILGGGERGWTGRGRAMEWVAWDAEHREVGAAGGEAGSMGGLESEMRVEDSELAVWVGLEGGQAPRGSDSGQRAPAAWAEVAAEAGDGWSGPHEERRMDINGQADGLPAPSPHPAPDPARSAALAGALVGALRWAGQAQRPPPHPQPQQATPSWQAGRVRVLAAWLLARLAGRLPAAVPHVLVAGGARELVAVLVDWQQQQAELRQQLQQAAEERRGEGGGRAGAAGGAVPLLPGEELLGLAVGRLGGGREGGTVSWSGAGAGTGGGARAGRFDHNAPAAASAALLALARSGEEGRRGVLSELALQQWTGVGLPALEGLEEL